MLVQVNTLEWIMYKPLLSFLFLNITFIVCACAIHDTATLEARRHLGIHSLLLQCRFRGSNVGQMSNLTGPVFETCSHCTLGCPKFTVYLRLVSNLILLPHKPPWLTTIQLLKGLLSFIWLLNKLPHT